MNWNGKYKNDILGSIASCREQIATVKQRGSSSPGAAWLLNQVNPKENKADLIGLVTPLSLWIATLPRIECEEWLAWAMTNHPIEVRQWMGYAPDWTMMPAAVCKELKNIVRLGYGEKLPAAYLIPSEPRKQDAARIEQITLDNGVQMDGVKLATVTYVKWGESWYKVYYPKLPSKSAISRAIRLYLLGIIVGRTVTSMNDLMVYEMMGVKSWMLFGNLENGIAEHASDALFHLLTEPVLGGELNG